MLAPTTPAIIAFLAHLEQDGPGGPWPLKCEQETLKALNTWEAWRESDRDDLKIIAGWNDPKRPYKVDPVAELVADAWAAFLFGEDPRVKARDERDQPLLDALLDLDPSGGTGTRFASDLYDAARIAVSEGEVWARVYVDRAVAPRPLLEWHSRKCILPLYVGPRLLAAAVITELGKMGDHEYRALEIHADGEIVNVLYRGKAGELGQRVDLTDHPATAGIEERWAHGLPGMLVERIRNRKGEGEHLGRSDYHGIQDSLIDLNEAASIGSNNMLLTARKRVAVSANVAQASTTRGISDYAPRVRFDPREEVFVDDPLDSELGGPVREPFRVIEYSFDASSLIAWRRDVLETALSRIGLNSQWTGTGGDAVGYAMSGTSLKLRLIPTTKAGRAKGRSWDDGVPRIAGTMIRVDALAEQAGGYGRPWTDTGDPIITRAPGIPADDLEEAQRHGILVNAGVESVEQAIRELHPDWDDPAIADEVARIRADKAAMAPGGTGSFIGG